MQIHFQLTVDDFTAASQHCLVLRKRHAWLNSILAWLAIGFVFVSVIPDEHSYRNWSTQQILPLLICTLYLLGLAWWNIWLRSKRKLEWQQQFAGDYNLTLTPSGMALQGPQGQSTFYYWQEIAACETIPQYVLLYICPQMPFPIPCHCFSSETACAEFVSTLQTLWCQSQNEVELPTQPRPRRLFAQFVSNLHQTCRIAFMGKLNAQAIYASRPLLCFTIIIFLLCKATAHYLNALPEPNFSVYGLTAYITSLCLMLLAATILSNRLLDRAALLNLFTLTTTCHLLSTLVFMPLFKYIGPLQQGHMYIWLYLSYVLWHVHMMVCILRQYYRQPAPFALYLASLYVALVFWAANLLPNTLMFYPSEPEEDNVSAEVQPDMEAIWYKQHQLIDQAVSQIQPASIKQTELYFIGFAGQSDEKVFSNEVQLAQQLMEQRFGAKHHAISLLNHKDTMDNIPLANAHNLDAVVQGVAKRMDKLQDVLFIFLSSHGAKDHSLSVSFWPLPFNDLKAEKLKEILDNSGIRHRVIVVSACYSGGFLDVLKDEHTLILTASSRDHVSYGCGDYTQYTYFGEAFFAKSLAQSNSFIDAFYQARTLISEQENKESKSHSEPQIHIGAAMPAKLAELKIQLVNKHTATSHK